MLSTDEIRRGGTFRVLPPPDRDRAGVWRVGGLGLLTLGVGAAAQAYRNDGDRLTSSERTVAMGVGGAYGMVGLISAVDGRALAKPVLRHPQRALLSALGPLVAVPMTGGRNTPLPSLTATTVGMTAVVYGHRTGQRAAWHAATLWVTLAHGLPYRGSAPSRGRTYVIQPVAFVVLARVAAALASVAYNARSLDAQLKGLAQQRAESRRFFYAFTDRLDEAAGLLAEALVETPAGDVQKLGWRALGRVHEARAVMRPALTAPERRARWHRYRGHAPARLKQDLTTLADDVLADVRDLLPVEVDTSGVTSLIVVGAERIGIIGATIVAGVVNAVRHTEGLRSIHVSSELEHGDLLIHVDSHGAEPAAPLAELGDGLLSLRANARAVRGDIDPGVTPDGAFRLTLRLPPVQTEHDEELALLAWSDIEAKVISVLDEAVLFFTVMVWVALVGRSRSSATRSVASTVAVASTPVTHYLSRQVEKFVHVPLMVSAFVSGATVESHHGALAGWTNAALSRHAVGQQHPWQTVALVTANLGGLTFPHLRGGVRGELTGQAATVAAGPVGILAVSLPAVRKLRQDELAEISTLATDEAVDRTVISFDGRHSSAKAIDDFTIKLNDRGREPALRQSADAIRRTVAPHVATERLLAYIVGLFATTVGRRTWPGTVTTRFESRAVGQPDKLELMSLRRSVITVGDLIAREAVSHKRVLWNGDRPVSDVEVIAVASELDLTVTVFPVAYRPADVDRVRARVLALDAIVLDWTEGGEITVLFPLQSAD
jgi:hypothetical protein